MVVTCYNHFHPDPPLVAYVHEEIGDMLLEFGRCLRQMEIS